MNRLVFLLMLLATALTAAPSTRLTIQVTSQSGKPVDRADVIVRFMGSRSVVKLGRRTPTRWELRTNQQGIAKIPPIPQGKILVQVTARNYQTFGETFEVEEDEKTIEVKLNPPQSQYSAHEKK